MSPLPDQNGVYRGQPSPELASIASPRQRAPCRAGQQPGRQPGEAFLPSPSRRLNELRPGIRTDAKDSIASPNEDGHSPLRGCLERDDPAASTERIVGLLGCNDSRKSILIPGDRIHFNRSVNAQPRGILKPLAAIVPAIQTLRIVPLRRLSSTPNLYVGGWTPFQATEPTLPTHRLQYVRRAGKAKR